MRACSVVCCAVLLVLAATAAWCLTPEEQHRWEQLRADQASYILDIQNAAELGHIPDNRRVIWVKSGQIREDSFDADARDAMSAFLDKGGLVILEMPLVWIFGGRACGPDTAQPGESATRQAAQEEWPIVGRVERVSLQHRGCGCDRLPTGAASLLSKEGEPQMSRALVLQRGKGQVIAVPAIEFWTMDKYDTSRLHLNLLQYAQDWQARRPPRTEYVAQLEAWVQRLQEKVLRYEGEALDKEALAQVRGVLPGLCAALCAEYTRLGLLDDAVRWGQQARDLSKDDPWVAKAWTELQAAMAAR